MLDLPQTAMSMSMYSPHHHARPIVNNDNDSVVDAVDAKFNATHLYYQKPHPLHHHHHHHHAVQIIQLVECSPPPRRIVSSDFYASSSAASDSEYSEDDDDEEEEEEDEEERESYCSSEEPLQGMGEPISPQQLVVQNDSASSSDTYNIRMKRILAWREDFSSHLSSTLSDTSIPSSLKRKLSINSDDNDAMSRTSKRSRSQSLSSRGDGTTSSSSSLGALSCPACDASFDTRQDLRQHGHEARAGANEACFVAVDYAFE